MICGSSQALPQTAVESRYERQAPLLKHSQPSRPGVATAIRRKRPASKGRRTRKASCTDRTSNGPAGKLAVFFCESYGMVALVETRE